MDSNDWTWEASPKKEFQRRRLERCYQLDYEDIKYKEECLTQVKELKKKQLEKKPMGYKRRPHTTPYWNFWRAVFAGWLIRYPGKIFKGIGMFFLFIVFLVFYSSQPTVEEPQNTLEPNPTIQYNKQVIQ